MIEFDPATATPSLEVVYGSRLYGTNQEDSDYDSVGFVVPPKKYRLGLYNSNGARFRFKTRELQDKENNFDRTLHDAEKFIHLLVRGNTIGLEAVFAAVSSKNVIHLNSFGRLIVQHREAFLSKQLHAPFHGYAVSERRKAFGETTGKLGAVRKDALEKHGYSPKNAYHCVRLLDEARSLLCDGTICFPFDQRSIDFYRSIRDAVLPASEVDEVIEDRLAQLDKALSITHLPDFPNYDIANMLLFKLYDLP